jgi:hypothetical protein
MSDVVTRSKFLAAVEASGAADSPPTDPIDVVAAQLVAAHAMLDAIGVALLAMRRQRRMASPAPAAPEPPSGPSVFMGASRASSQGERGSL